MSDRPRKPSRSGLFSGANPPGRPLVERADPLRETSPGSYHPASPTPLDPSKPGGPTGPDDRTGAVDDRAKQFALTLRDLIESLPPRADSAAARLAPAPQGIPGVTMPAFEDHPAVERQARTVEDVPGGGPSPSDFDRVGPPTRGRLEADATARPDLARSDRRDEDLVIPSTALSPGGPEVDLPGYPTSERSPGPVESALEPTCSGIQPDVGGSFGGDGPGERSLAIEVPMAGIAAAPAAGVDLRIGPVHRGIAADLGPSGSESSGVDDGAGESQTIAVGPVGSAGRFEESFDRPPSSTAPTASWGGSSGGDPSGAVRSPVEGASGADFGPTNALLERILDELRRQHRSAPIASGRSVYPER